MRCAYCDVEVTEYPASGICTCCGGKLPPRPTVQPVSIPAQPIHIHVQQTAYGSAAMLCPKCGSTQILSAKRGFSWGLGILGFFLFPGFGILLGFCGSKKPRWNCAACGRKWKHF